MTEKPNATDRSDIEELLISNTIQLDAVIQLLIQKDLFSKEEFSDMLRLVQKEYQDEE